MNRPKEKLMFRTRSDRAGIVAGSLALVLLASACGDAGESEPSASGAAGDSGLKGKTVALVGYGKANSWGAYYNQVFNEQLAATGVRINDMTSMDSGTQVQKFNQSVAQKPDLIVLAIWYTAAMA